MNGCVRVAAVLLVVASGLLGGCASQVRFPALAENVTLSGDLRRPDRGGALPAVVLLAPCGGVTTHMGEWARWLNDQGYVTLVVDSFSPRRSFNACRGGPPTVPQVAQDADDALRYLKTLPFVDGRRVVAMGWSHGGGAALEASSRAAVAQSGAGERAGFRAVVAFYPPCWFLSVRTRTPTLVLVGALDDWTPAGQCVAIGESARQLDAPVSWQVYPNAPHAFDRPDATPYLGHAMWYDREAALAAREAVRKYLSEQLQGEP